MALALWPVRYGSIAAATAENCEEADLHLASEQGGSSRGRLTENILSLYILQGLNYVVPMAVLPYLVRVLGMEMYGLVAFAQSFAQYFTLFTDYGFNFSATRSIARQRDDSKAVSKILCSVLLIKLALMFVGAVILLAIVATVPRFHQSSGFFIAAYLAVAGNVLFPTSYFQGMEKMRYISVVIGLARLLGAIALFVFVHRPEDALRSLVIQSLALVVGGIAGLWVAVQRFHLEFNWPGFAHLRSTLVEGWHLFVSTAAIGLYSNTNLFLVGLLAGNLQAGYFSAAEKVLRAMQGLIVPVSQAVFPHMSALAARSRSSALRFAERTLKWMGAITLTTSIAVLILARPIAELCFGQAGGGSVPVIRWIAPLPFLVAVSNVLGIQIMVTFGLDKQFSRILIFAGLLNISLAIPLIHLFAAKGAGASVLCTECFVSFVMILILRLNKIRLFSPERQQA
ncbi:MAG: flippase [Acidobacteriaceae bacterium]|jgi:PST family polysaccharide transporter